MCVRGASMSTELVQRRTFSTFVTEKRKKKSLPARMVCNKHSVESSHGFESNDQATVGSNLHRSRVESTFTKILKRNF